MTTDPKKLAEWRDKWNELGAKLVAMENEVERLRAEPKGMGLMLKCDQMESEIESLTQERDRYKNNDLRRIEINEKLEAEIYDLGINITEVYATNKRLAKELAASEKAGRINKLWNIAVKCNLCGAIFPDNHTSPCR